MIYADVVHFLCVCTCKAVMQLIDYHYMTYCYSVRKMGFMFCDCYFATAPYNSCPREHRAMNAQISKTFQIRRRRRKIDCIMHLLGNVMYGVFARSAF